MFNSRQSSISVTLSRHGATRHPYAWRLSLIRLIVLGFTGIMLLGAALLLLPASQRPGVLVAPLDCLFTATSALCGAGLVTVSTADSWSTLGLLVILALMQLGGIAFMTGATLIALLLGQRVGLRTRLHMEEVPGVLSPRDALRVLRVVVISTAIIEAAGALALTTRFLFGAYGYSWHRALFEGVFYSVSAFCNVGFDLVRGFTGLASPHLRDDGWLLTILGILIILGGLGFGVLVELAVWPRVKRLSLHAKLALVTTVLLIAAGMLMFIFFEARNDATLGQLSGPSQRLLTSWFMSVSARSGGFAPVSIDSLSPPTFLTLALLMIVGASPGSTGGGVKTTTLAVILLAIFSLMRYRSDIEIFGRRISGGMVRMALSLLSVYLGAMLLVILGISFTEISLSGLEPSATSMTRYLQLAFEVTSAFGLSGMSAGVTHTLAPFSRALIIVSILLGRLGPLAFVYIFSRPRQPQYRRLPTEVVMAG